MYIMKTFTNYNLLFLLFILLILGFLYKRFNDKLEREERGDNYEAIRQYLLDDETLGKSKKPIMWVHVPYEYNSRKWLSFGSRSSLDLNQPYLFLTVRSIIKHCDESFTICIIDDYSFKKLLPEWNIDLTTISSPILDNMRLLGLMKLMYKYGGCICPISFLCFKDLIGLYEKGTGIDFSNINYTKNTENNGNMFVCEMVNRNITSSVSNFFPSLTFCGAPKECGTVLELCEFIQRTITDDSTADSKFSGDFEKWILSRRNKKINIIEGNYIGTKTNDDEQITLDDLMSNHYLKLFKGSYGIYIPANEIISRVKYEWFSRLSQKQVLETDTIIGNYLLLSTSPGKEGILQPLEPIINSQIENKFVSFWKIPLNVPYFGLKPNFLGDNVAKITQLAQ